MIFFDTSNDQFFLKITSEIKNVKKKLKWACFKSSLSWREVVSTVESREFSEREESKGMSGHVYIGKRYRNRNDPISGNS
jgi:hypothetical protein